MSTDRIAEASVTIDAPRERVFEALVNPKDIKEYMFGAEAVSDWEEGARVVWRGEWKGKRYEDKGVILELKPAQRLRYTHFSPLSGEPDVPESYHTVTVELTEEDDGTLLTLTQDNNATADARRHSEENWGRMLEDLKDHIEGAS